MRPASIGSSPSGLVQGHCAGDRRHLRIGIEGGVSDPFSIRLSFPSWST